MKILILQLARLGDIYSSRPSIRALRRKFPNAEISLMVRPRFRSATDGLTEVDRIIDYPTTEFFSPLFEEGGVESSLDLIKSFCETLKNENWTYIYNLTFSPLSSYLTHAITNENAVVSGYTRHSDGHLNLPDDTSAYFYAQVGIQRYNRFHLYDIFSSIMDVELSEDDYETQFKIYDLPIKGPYIVVHVGASQDNKQIPPECIIDSISQVLKIWNGTCVLIGAEHESYIGQNIQRQIGSGCLDLTGKTELSDLFSIINGSEGLLGPDSAPIHIASLVDKPVINVSFSTVNLWETGPRSAGSRILLYTDRQSVSAGDIAIELLSLVQNKPPRRAQYYVDMNHKILPIVETQDLAWEFINLLYLSGPCPKIDRDLVFKALINLRDVNKLAIEQLYILQGQPGDLTAQALCARADEIILSIESLVPEVGVITRWFQAERIRIAPDEFRTVLEKTFVAHRQLETVVDHILSHNVSEINERNKNGNEELGPR